jgi:hypothetical protein
MKFKLQIQTLAASLFVIALLATAAAQPVSKQAPSAHPAGGFPAPGGAPPMDPATGLPLPPAPPKWIDENWSDPDIILTNVTYDGLPLNEVAKHLRDCFQGQFDILPMPGTYGTDWGRETLIQLQLKNVRASEVFNAMNLVFENDQTPLRWELKASGHPLVLLRVLPEAAPKTDPFSQPKPTETHRMVYFVGNLIGDEKSGGMTMDQIIKTISEIWPADLGKPEEVIQFHKDAQMLIVNGTRNQLDLIQQTLQALGRKAELARPKANDSDLKELEELGRLLQKEPYSNILKSIFNSGQK